MPEQTGAILPGSVVAGPGVAGALPAIGAVGAGIDAGGAELMPVPFGIPGGIPANIIAAANRFGQAGGLLSENQGRVQDMSDLGQWQGEAASAHQAFSATLGSNFASASSAAQEIAGILRDFAAQLTELQNEANHAMAEWVRAWEEQQSLQSQLGLAHTRLAADRSALTHDGASHAAPGAVAGDRAKLSGDGAVIASLAQSSANATDAMALWSQRGQAIWDESSVLGRSTAGKLAAISVPMPPTATPASPHATNVLPTHQAHRNMLGDLIAGGVVAGALAEGVRAEVRLDQDILDIEAGGLAATPAQFRQAAADEEKVEDINAGVVEVADGAGALKAGIEDGTGSLAGLVDGVTGDAEVAAGEGLLGQAGATNATDTADSDALVNDADALTGGPVSEPSVGAGNALSGSETIYID